MDKNMINIDELVRDRLSGGEEKERTGAWLQMRELLDKKMPVETTPVAFGWKRITGYIAGVVLLVALSVGGYKTMTHGDADNQIADNPAGNATANDGNGTAHAGNGNAAAGNGTVATTENDAATGNGISGNPNSTTPNNYGQDNNTARPANNNRNNNNRNNRSHTAAGNTGAQKTAGNTVHTGTGDRIAKTENITGPNNTADNGAANSTAANLPSNTNNTNQSGASGNNNTGATNIGASVNGVHNTARNSTHSVQPVNPENVPHRHNNSGNSSATGTTGFAASTATVVPAANNNTSNSAATHNLAGNNHTNGGDIHTTGTQHDAAGNNVAPAPVMKKDTLEKIRLVQHYSRRHDARGVFNMDTIGVEQMIVSRPLENILPTAKNNPAYSSNTARKTNPATAQKTPSDVTITPAAASIAAKANNSLDADANSNLVPLANYRVASRKMNWDPQRFEEMVNRFKYNLAQLKFYPGIVAGINASMFGPNSFGGFQLGLSSTIAFNERLSLGAELKYISRFNSGVSVTDDYAGKPTDSNAIYNAQGTALEFMNYTRDSTHHYFNFSMLHSIELPVSVRYSIGRFFLMGGLNFAYHIKVDAEEVERHLTAQTVVPYNHPPITWPEGKASINSRDFSSRFAIGGLFGIGYEMTPAVQLDFRMTKSLWDNARTNGAKLVSDQLYRSPSLQLSIGYRFSQQKH